MIEMTLGEIADAVGGELRHGADPSTVVNGMVHFDSRQVAPGDIFAAIRGAHVDGHDFAEKAIAAGAVVVLAAREVPAPCIVVPRPAQVNSSNLLIYEADTDGSAAAIVTALGALAHENAARLPNMRTICITGSSGKTSTKDLIASVLRVGGNTVARPGSANNEVGYPWTALQANKSTEFLVLEAGARGVGHIAGLTSIVRPDISVVVNVGSAHVGEFGSRETTARAKGELVEALSSDGVAILNADDTLVSAMAQRSAGRVVTFGYADTATVRATDVELDELARPRFTVHTPEGAGSIYLKVHGEHQVSNALAAVAVGRECGIALDAICAALSASGAQSARRMDVRTTASGITVINDSYNANPESMKAALKALVSIARNSSNTETTPTSTAESTTRSGRGSRRKTWAVLGEMGELGDDSVMEHDAIGRFVVRLDVNQLVCVGTSRSVRGLFQGAIMEGSWGSEAVMVDDQAAALQFLKDNLATGDVVLVKASRSAALWTVAEGIVTSQQEASNT